ncbi:MAG: YkgJ family cysteine cluster protein [Deltaproteobacteria bacterium]|nr:YkgJ family cysteine cluster protein [Deltaproteobacteria bacterium]
MTLKILGMPRLDEWEHLRSLKRALHPEDYAVNPCRFCSAECCKSAIRLTLIEVLRIAFTLGLPLQRFLEPHALSENDGPSGNCEPLLLDVGEVELRLRRQEGGHCMFVKVLDEGEMICSIHGLRPGACRFFPFSIEEENGGKFHVGAQLFCPAKWIQDDGLDEHLESQLFAWREDLVAEKEFVALWNSDDREDRSFSALLLFIFDEVAPALGYDSRRLSSLPKRGLGKRFW